MDNSGELFRDFIDMVNVKYHDFVLEFHDYMIKNGCKVQIKTTSSGYLVSYIMIKTKKTVTNFVFRKSGLLIRIYADCVNQYPEFLETLPAGMIKTIQKASICKRLINPDDCNQKCKMGYDFIIKGERYQKCRNSAFFFLICEESNNYVKEFLVHELDAQK